MKSCKLNVVADATKTQWESRGHSTKAEIVPLSSQKAHREGIVGRSTARTHTACDASLDRAMPSRPSNERLTGRMASTAAW